MRFKLPKRFSLKSAALVLISAALGLASHSALAVSISPYLPNTVVDTGSGELGVYYLAATFSGIKAPTFPQFDFASTSSANDLYFNITGIGGSDSFFWVLAEDKTNSTTYYPVPITDCGYGTPIEGRCESSTATGLVLRLNLKTICSTALNKANIRGCDSSTGNVIEDNTTTGSPLGFRFRFITNTGSTPGITGSTGSLLVVTPQKSSPTITAGTCAQDPGFFPGDGVILVDTNLPKAFASTTGSSPSFPTFWTFANPSNTVVNPTDPFSSTIQFGAPFNSNQAEVSGFINQTQSPDPAKFYGLKFGVQDSAGAVALCSEDLQNAFSTDIQGFLKESNCFIATASYRDGRAPGVMLLREFRDEVLTNYASGRAFIGWYYIYGPIAANWLIDHSIFRGFFLTLLLPLQIFAWITLHPAILWIPFFSLLALLAFAFRKKILPSPDKKTGLALLILATCLTFTNSVKAASEQPYIDSLVSELPKEEYVPKPGNETPYINSIKKSAGNPNEADGYAESLKKELPKSDGSEGYAERLQKRVPKETGSAIEDYRKGRQLKADMGTPDISDAFGFRILASATRTYTAGANQDVSYDSVYGDSWVPDFSLHYEKRPFKSDFMKGFGVYGSAGASFTHALGKLEYQDTRFGSDSKTQFKFIVLPVNVGLMYHVNIFHVFNPYFGAGPSVIGFVENRNDDKGGKHGYAFGYWFSAGVALGLDWISPSNAYEQYSNNGVKHSYLTLGYNRLESFGGGLVEFTVDGIEAGFTFEL